MFRAKALFGWAHHCPHHINVVAIDFSSMAITNFTAIWDE
jgi:hypothetical protein